MRIAISPDENPGDPGSVGPDSTTERSVNVRIATALEAALRRCGQDAWFDPSITFTQRVQRANADGTTLLIACANNEDTPGVSGTQFVFCAPDGPSFGHQAALADAIFAELWSGGLTSGRRRDFLGAIAECCDFRGDTAYVEFSCMSPDDQHFWSDPHWAVAVAEATARGVAKVFGFAYLVPTPPPPSPPGRITMLRTIVTERRVQYLLSGSLYVHLVDEADAESLDRAGVPPWPISGAQHDALVAATGGKVPAGA